MSSMNINHGREAENMCTAGVHHYGGMLGIPGRSNDAPHQRQVGPDVGGKGRGWKWNLKLKVCETQQ